jgi:hypothetical protein
MNTPNKNGIQKGQELNKIRKKEEIEINKIRKGHK